MRILHLRDRRLGRSAARRTPTRPRPRCAPRWTTTCAGAVRTTGSSGRCSRPPECGRAAIDDPSKRAGALPPSLPANPRLGDWLSMPPTGIVEIRSGKVELGQGVLTALAQIAAEELDVGVDRVRMMPAATDLSPDEGYTAGSLSIQHSGAALRDARRSGARSWRRRRQLAVPARKLTVRRRPGLGAGRAATSYWELADDALLDRAANGHVAPKPASAYRVVGTSVARMDLPDKLAVRPRYVHDLSPARMVYGRVVRPPSRGATLSVIEATRRSTARRGRGGARRRLPRGGGRTRGGGAVGSGPAAAPAPVGAEPDVARRGRLPDFLRLGAGRDHRRRRDGAPRRLDGQSQPLSKRPTTGPIWRTRSMGPSSATAVVAARSAGCGCGRTARASICCGAEMAARRSRRRPR